MKSMFDFIKKNLKRHIIAGGIAMVIVIPFTWLIQHWQDDNVVEHIKIIANFITNYLVIIDFGLMLVIISIIELLAIGKKCLKRGLIAFASGMFYYSPNHTKRHLKKSEQFLKKNSDHIFTYILGATGWKTFGNPNSPLHETLKTCQESKIILAYPLSDAVLERSERLEMIIDDYREEIYNSIIFLSDLKNKGCHIELKMYQAYPMWKYIVLDEYVWVQQYPRAEHVKNSPSYAFERTTASNKKAIYHHIHTQFLTRWDSHRLGVYNFETEELEFKNANGDITNSKSIR